MKIRPSIYSLKSRASIVIALAFITTALVACSTAIKNTPASKPPALLIRYLGHSSFYLLASDGTRIVTDPYGASPPFLTFSQGIEADLVTISHMHADHSAVGNVGGQPIILLKPETRTVGMVKVTGYPALHGEYQGTMISNTIFVFECGDVKVVHLGELGRIGSPDTLKAIADADVIFVPIGVAGAMPYDQIKDLLDKVGARTVIPQHFSLSASQRWYGLGTVEEFLAAMPDDLVGQEYG